MITTPAFSYEFLTFGFDNGHLTGKTDSVRILSPYKEHVSSAGQKISHREKCFFDIFRGPRPALSLVVVSSSQCGR